MKARILLLLLLACPFLGRASHIVGGEFELVHINGFQYRLNLILYFDEKFGTPGAKDLSAAVRIFRMSDNFRMMDVTLPLISEFNVEYTQPACSNGEIETSKLLYSTLITLSPDLFNHPGGYYVAWERCCRNYTITNIYSQVPGPGARYAGQTFYLEFPPVVKDGVPFVDSTPRLFPPLNDFGCPNRLYYTDFSGTDDDGDSLVYSLVEPLNTKSDDAIPPGGTRPRPYPPVTWKAPFSFNNIMGGITDLQISKDGLLTVTPFLQGLMVFAVKVEEFRGGVKIGETRRDFQMLIFDGCGRAVPPKIVGVTIDDQVHEDNVALHFDNTEPDATRTIKVRVWDEDSELYFDGEEYVRIKAVALNFKKELSDILPVVKDATLLPGDTVEFTISFPGCPYLYGGDPVIGILAMDDACTLPLSDTLRITLDVDPPPNNVPYFTTPNVNQTVHEGNSFHGTFDVKDDDDDPLVVSVLTNGFVLASAGMTFATLHQAPGEANGVLDWDAFCNIYDFTHRTNFLVTVRVDDQDLCNQPNPVTAFYNLTVIDLPENTAPNIDSDLTPNPSERFVSGITRRINESIIFNVTGLDHVDNDYLVMSAKGQGFELSNLGAVVTPGPASGNGEVSTGLQWDIACSTLSVPEPSIMAFQFIVVDDDNYCHFHLSDTLDVELTILPPLNQPPALTLVNNNPGATELSNGELSLTLGATIDLTLMGTDGDVLPGKDNLVLALTGAEGNVAPSGYAFDQLVGTSPVSRSFVWTPNCSIFRNGNYENEYTFTFHLDDDHCLTEKRDSVVLKVHVKDVDGSDAAFIPPNFVSPNGDDKNDYYAMETLIPETGEIVSIMPNDNCASRFEYVRIYNRWGKEVFRSSSRDFRWFPDETAAGVYYYSIKFTVKEYHGALTVRY